MGWEREDSRKGFKRAGVLQRPCLEMPKAWGVNLVQEGKKKVISLKAEK